MYQGWRPQADKPCCQAEWQAPADYPSWNSRTRTLFTQRIAQKFQLTRDVGDAFPVLLVPEVVKMIDETVLRPCHYG